MWLNGSHKLLIYSIDKLVPTKTKRKNPTEYLMNLDLPSDIPLTKTVRERMKIINDVLPSIAISFLTKCCPTSAAAVATATK